MRYLILFCLIACQAAFAQNKGRKKEVVKGVKIIARPLPDSVLLRWAPTDQQTWALGNKYGYVLERYAMVEGKVAKRNPAIIVLSPQPIKPYPLEQWEPIAKASNYGAIAAQALYGETFEATQPKNQKMDKPMVRQAYEKAMEMEMRFSFALLGADLNKEVAKASGLKWTDRKVKKGDRYLYRIYVALPPDISLKLDTGFVFTGPDEFSPLPKPAEFSAFFSDTTVALSWNQKLLQAQYIAYDIEQSSDGGITFQKRNQEPFIGINEKPDNPYVFYMDTTHSRKELIYRIRGLNSFGEFGPYSNLEKGVCRPVVKLAPEDVKVNIIDNKEVVLTWKYDRNNLKNITGFRVYRSDQMESGYKPVSSQLLPPSTLSFKDSKPLSASYYKVCAVDGLEQEKESFSVLAQLEDHDPPAMPAKVTGTIAKDGQVTLSWIANQEQDLLGYYVYRGNDRKQEDMRVTGKHIQTPSFSEKLNLRSLTDSVYYRVIAIDGHYNESKSTILALRKPDVLPPAPVSIQKNTATEKGIYLMWANSVSKDATQYRLIRTSDQSLTGELLVTLPHKGDTTAYLDSTVALGQEYRYDVLTVDAMGLTSVPIQSLKLQKLKPIQSTTYASIKAVRDTIANRVFLNWQAKGTAVKHWVIYRGAQGERLSQYQSAKGNSFVDTEILKSKAYFYHLRPVYLDGEMGPLSIKIEVDKKGAASEK